MRSPQLDIARIRALEEKIAKEYNKGLMRSPVHLATGAEAIAVGVCSQLRRKDHVYGNHRSHGHYLAKGGDITKLVAELHGRSSGCSGGIGGSMHLVDESCGFMGTSPILAASVPVAVGDAFQANIDGDDRVVVVFVGDGATEEGVFYESMNFARLHKLKLLVVVEDNGLAVETPAAHRRPDLWKPQEAFGLDVMHTFSHSPKVIATDTQTLLDRLPAIMWSQVERMYKHVGPETDRDPRAFGTEEFKQRVEDEMDAVWEVINGA